MPFLWDYHIKNLKRSKSPRAKILFLERQINYGLDKNEKINLNEVKKYWPQLNLFPRKQRLFEFLIWGK